MKQYLSLTLLTLSLLLGLASFHIVPVSAHVYTDPQGDTFGRGPVQLDISSIDAQFNKTYLVFKTTFYTPVSPPHTFASNSVGGYIDVDSDRNPTTGALSFIDRFKPIGYPGSGLGDEYFISIFFEANNPGLAGVYNAATFFLMGAAPITFTSNSYAISVPLSFIGGTGLINYGTIIGTFSEPTDLAPNSCCATSELMTPPPKTILSLNPTVSTAPKGGAFQVSVQVANATTLNSFDIFLNFDPTLLTGVLASDSGSVLRNYCSATPGCSGVSSQFNIGPGFIEMKGTLLGTVGNGTSLPGFSGNGLVFTAILLAAKTGLGTTPIRIASNSLGVGEGGLATSTGAQLQHSSVDGVFSNNGPDLFVQSAPDEFTLVTNSSDTSTVTVYALNGLTGTVNLAVSSLPSNVHVTLSQTSLSLTGASASTKLTVNATATSLPGNYTISITASTLIKSKTLTESGTLQLTILPPVPDFSISFPSSVFIPSGESGSVTVTVTSIQGFNGPVSMSLTFPQFSGLSGSFNINPVRPPMNGQAFTNLTILVSALTFPQTVPLTVSATSGSTTHTSTLTLHISSFFIFGPIFPVTLQPGGTVVTSATIFPVNGFSGTVQLGLVPVPPDITATLSPTNITISSSGTNSTRASVTIAITASPTAKAGNVVIFITGTSGRTFAVGQIQLLITDFSLASSPSDVTIPATGSTNSTIFLSSLNGFNGLVGLQVSGAPAGVSASISPNFSVVNAGGTGSASLILNSNSATAGNYLLTITGSNGPTVHTSSVRLHVVDFSISSSPSTLTLSARQISNVTLNVTPLNGFSQPVVFTVSGVPFGVSATLIPANLQPGGGTSTLTLTVSKNPLLGTFNLVVTATSGSVVHTTTIVLTIAK